MQNINVFFVRKDKFLYFCRAIESVASLCRWQEERGTKWLHSQKKTFA